MECKTSSGFAILTGKVSSIVHVIQPKSCGGVAIVSLFLHRSPCYGNEIDTIPRSRKVRKVMSQMGPIDTDGFSILQTTHIFPIDFVVAEAGPTMRCTFSKEGIQRATLGSSKQELPCVAVVELDLSSLVVLLLGILEEGRRLPVTLIVITFRISNHVRVASASVDVT